MTIYCKLPVKDSFMSVCHFLNSEYSNDVSTKQALASIVLVLCSLILVAIILVGCGLELHI